MTVLHVACLPFPTYQGTQAAIASMLSAAAEQSRTPHLLAYAGQAYEANLPFPVHRIRGKVRSYRSGPSWEKLLLDARAVAELRRLCRALRPNAIVAHHIEAAVAALAARAGPVHYFAHTSLPDEMPTYFPSLPSRPIASAARALEHAVCGRAAAVAAVSPALAGQLGGVHVPIPWRPMRTASAPPEEARRRLGIPAGDPVALYAGNLDRYQGWEYVIAALAILRRTHASARLLIATESDPIPAKRRAEQTGLGTCVHFCRLAGEGDRGNAHAAADLAWVPRRSPGGLPVKMLDAFARGLPVVAMKRATAGLSVDEACIGVPNDDAVGLADAAARLLTDAKERDRLRSASLAYLRRVHDPASFDTALRRFLGAPMPRNTETATVAKRVPSQLDAPLST